MHTNDLNNQLHVDKIADNTEIVVQGNGAIADQIFQDKANADKLAGVVVGGADNAVLTDKVTTEEGVIGGAFEGTVDKDGHVVRRHPGTKYFQHGCKRYGQRILDGVESRKRRYESTSG